MSGDEKDTGQEEGGKTEVKENESKPPPSSERLIKSDEAATQANASIAEDQELKVLPENEEEEGEKIVEVEDAAIKSLPRATTKKEITIPNVSKRLEQQSTEIKKVNIAIPIRIDKTIKISIKASTKTDLTNSKTCSKKKKIK